MRELRSLWQKAREIYNATIIQQTFIDVSETLFGSYDRLVPAAPTRVVARLNDRLCEAAIAGWRFAPRYRARQRTGRN